MKIIPIWFHQKSQSYPQSGFSNEFISQIHMSQIIFVVSTCLGWQGPGFNSLHQQRKRKNE